MEDSKVVSVELVELIEVVSTIGSGTENDPVRYIKQYFTKGGELLAQHDDWGDSNS